MDNHFIEGFFGLFQQLTVVLCRFLALFNYLSYFATNAISLDKYILWDLGSDVVYLKQNVS